VGTESAKIGQGKAFKNKWIKKDGEKLLKEAETVVDQTQQDLLVIRNTGSHSDAETLKDLKKRKLIDRQYVSFVFAKQFSLERARPSKWKRVPTFRRQFQNKWQT
jgi:hypothetical protein